MPGNMRIIIYYLFKVVMKFFSDIRTLISSSMFRFSLWYNDVIIGRNICAVNSTPCFWRQNGGSCKISIGDNVTLISYGDQSYNCRCKIMVEKDANLTIGHDTGFNGVLIYCQDSITIGNYVKVGGGTRIFDTDHHPINWQERREPGNGLKAKHAPIVIEDDVFIGAGCYILKGVTIGARSVVAAGSVVVKDVPADEVWGGNPAKFIKKLGSSDKCVVFIM